MTLHIGYVEAGYPHPHGGGGAGTYVRLVGRELVRRGHRVTVLAGPCPDCPAYAEDEGIAVHRPSFRLPLHWYASRLPGIRKTSLALRYLEQGYRKGQFLNGLHRKDPFNVVEFAEGGVFWNAFRSPFPYIAHLHGSRYTFLRQAHGRTNHADWWERRLELVVIGRARHVFSPSQAMAKLVREELGRALPGETILPYPLDPELMSITPKVDNSSATRKMVYFAARSDPVKGGDVLQKAIPLIRAQVPDAEFLFVGFRPSEAERPMSGVRCLPFLPRAEALAYLDDACVCVIPSLFDNSPTTVYEAMARGRAVVASRVGGIPELVDEGVTGLLVEPGNPKALAAALVRLLANTEERASMGKAGLQRIQQIAGFEHNVAERLNLYRQLADELAAKDLQRNGLPSRALARPDE